jgi:hypothetical protein
MPVILALGRWRISLYSKFSLVSPFRNSETYLKKKEEVYNAAIKRTKSCHL